MIKQVKFSPWVGSTYRQGVGGKRILALGESHYCEHPDEAVEGLTINVIRDLFDPNSPHEHYKNTYTKFIHALAGHTLDPAGKEAWWNRIVFYNYVQTPISGPRKEPSKQEFIASEAAFFEVLEAYRPDGVIAWGARLYENLPGSGRRLPDLIRPDGSTNPTWGYDLPDGHTVQLLPITHPSAAFTPDYWHQVIAAFIKRMG